MFIPILISLFVKAISILGFTFWGLSTFYRKNLSLARSSGEKMVQFWVIIGMCTVAALILLGVWMQPDLVNLNR